jgi:hypothetical protein
MIIASISCAGVIAGAAAAVAAKCFPAYVEGIETGAGILMVGGLLLLGSALPTFL